MRQKIRLLYLYLRLAICSWFKKRKSNRNKFVFVNLKDNRIAPYYAYLIFLLHYSGYQISIKTNIQLITSLIGGYLPFLELSTVKFCWLYPSREGRKKYSLVYDRFVHPMDDWKSKIFIDLSIFKNQNKKQILPYHMSPGLYLTRSFEELHKLRESQKNIKILFSGNQDQAAYNHPILNEYFGKLTRVQALQQIIDHLADSELQIVADNEDFNKNKFVLLKWNWSPLKSNGLINRVPDENWLPQLAKSNFFFCASGIRMPLCFNSVEAMAVGTIPILEYPELFNPPLIHLQNAIVFHGYDDLIEKIRLALSMNAKQITEMSGRVANYFDKYMSPEAGTKIIEEVEKNGQSIFIYAEQASLDDSSNILG